MVGVGGLAVVQTAKAGPDTQSPQHCDVMVVGGRQAGYLARSGPEIFTVINLSLLFLSVCYSVIMIRSVQGSKAALKYF